VIEVSVTLDGAAKSGTAPTVLFVGKTAASDAVTMAAGAGTNEWTASYTVESADDAPGIDGQFTFTATATSAADTVSTITQAAVATAPPVIDRVAPAVTASMYSDTNRDIELTFSEDLTESTVTSANIRSGTQFTYAQATPPGYQVVLAFSEALNPTTAVTANFGLALGETSVPVMATYAAPASGAVDSAVTLALTGASPASGEYTVTVSGSVEDASGNAVAEPSRSIQVTLDATAPEATAARFDGLSAIVLSVSEPLDTSTVTSHIGLSGGLSASSAANEGAAGSREVRLELASPAAVNTRYTVTLSAMITDLSSTPNALGAGTLPATSPPRDGAVATPAAASARTTSLTTTVVTFGDPLGTGTADAADWTLSVGSVPVMVTSLRAGEHSEAASAPITSVDMSAEPAAAPSDKITLVHASLANTGKAPTVEYDGTGTISAVGAPAAVPATSPPHIAAADGVAPTVTGTSYADATRTITLTFGEGLAESTVTASNIDVYGFDGANVRSAAELALDTTLDADGIDYAQNAGGTDDEPSTVMIRLASADIHTHYKVVISSSVTDAASPAANAYVPIADATPADSMDDADITVEKTDSQPPRATAISFTVHDGTPGANTAKSGAYALWAGAGDTIRMSLTLNEAAGGTPMITVPGTGRTPTASPMVNTGSGMAGAGDATTWHHDIAVGATTAETVGDSSVAFTFSIAVADTVAPTANTGTITQANSGLSLSLPYIDTTDPAATVTTSARLEGQSADAPASTVAGIGDEVRVSVAAGEELVTAADDIGLFGSQAASAGSVTPPGASASPTYARTVAAGDAEGMIEFSLTIRDRAGNEATLTHDDAAARVSVDSSAPTLSSARTTSATTLTVTLSEALPASATTVPGDWTAVDTVPDPDISATPSAASVSGSTVTLTYAAIPDTAFAPTVTYAGTGLADAGRNAVAAQSQAAAADGVGPVPSNARFVGGSIAVDLSEPIAAPPTTGYSATATGTPAGNDLGTLTPSYTAGASTLTLSPANAPAVDLAAYTVALPALSDTQTPANAGAAASLTATVPDRTAAGAASLAVSVEDGAGGTFTARTGANAHYASEGDRITVAVTFDEDVSGTPTITVHGDASTRVEGSAAAAAMGDAGDADARTWSHELTVDAADDEGALRFDIRATDARGMVMGTLTQAAITAGSNAIVDMTAPSLAATADALYTRARHAGENTDTSADPAGIGGQVRVYVRATEPIVTAAGDATFYAAGLAASGTEAAASAGANSHAYWRTVAAGDANGPVEFALAIRDRAGNEASYTHADLTTGRGDGTGHRTSVDTVRPTASAAFTGNAITVTFSEAAYGVPASLAVTPPGRSASQLAASHDDGDTAARISIAAPVAVGTWTVAIPAAVTDQARNALASAPVSLSAERTGAPVASAISYRVLPPTGSDARAAPFDGHAREGDRIELTITLGEAAMTAPTVLFVGKTAASDAVTMAAGAGANEWAATYTVETAAAAPGIDGQFTFAATVTGDTGSVGTVTQADTAAAAPVIDRVAPTITSAAFSEARTITVSLSERMAREAATIEGYTYMVRAPDGTNAPDDADSDADVIPLSTVTLPAYAEAGAGSAITLTLASGATDGVEYTVELPAELSDEAGNALAVRTRGATYDPPAASALSFTVYTGEPSPSTQKTGTYSTWAGIGDIVVVSLDLDADAASPPEITLAGRGTDAVAMGDAGDADASTWSHAHTVLASHASTSQASPLGISISAVGMTGSIAEITPSSGLAPGASVSLPTIDTVPPALDAGDSLYTRTVYDPPAGDAVTYSGVAGIGDQVWVRVDATEKLVTPAREAIMTPDSGATPARADMTFFPGTASAAAATKAVSRSDTDFVYNYSRTVAAGDPEGPVTFSLVIRDRAGNEAALTHADLTGSATDAGGGAIAGAGYRAPIDSSAPALSSARTASPTTLEVTLSEALPASASTAAGDWAVTDTAPDPDVTATPSAAEVSGSTVTLTYAAVPDTSFAPTVTYTGAGLADAARNAVAAQSQVAASDGVAPTATAMFAGLALTVTFSEPVNSVPATLALTRPDGSTVEPQFAHADGERTATASISAADAAAGTWRVAIPAAVTDAGGIAIDASSRDIAAEFADAPMASAISYSVSDAAGAARPPPYAAHAREGDTVGLSVTLDMAVHGTPTVLFVGKTADGDRVAMAAGAGANEWTASYTVESAAAAPGIDGRFTFAMSVVGQTSRAEATITDRSLAASPPTIDRVAPAFAAQTSSLDRVTVTFTEPVSGTTAASEWGVGGTAPAGVASGGAAQPGDLALAGRSSLTLDLAAGSGLADGAARPAVSFGGRASGGIADLAGNALAPTAAPHVTATDRIRPALESAEFVDADTLAVTLSEPVERSTVLSLPASSISPPLGPISVSYVAGETALTLDTQGSAAERATHTFTMPTSVTDAANGAELGNNNFAAGSSASARLADTTAPAPDTVRTVDERTVASRHGEPLGDRRDAGRLVHGGGPGGAD